MPAIAVAPHPLLDLAALEVACPPGALRQPSPGWLVALLRPAAPPSGDGVRRAVRDLLRHGGFKPTGRSKPSAEYLASAAAAGRLSAINALVDAANAVSLDSGLPVSVIDLERVEPPLRVAVAAAGERYEFNPAGQVIDVGRLLCLHDARGPCANAVKDAQRTKTGPDTRRALLLVWGMIELPGRARAAAARAAELLARLGGFTVRPAAVHRVG